MPRIHISFASIDSLFASRLAKDINDLGFVPFLDEWITEDLGSDGAERKLDDKNFDADYLIVVMTPEFLSIAFKGNEWKSRYLPLIQGGARILPILRKKCHIPAYLSNMKYADFQETDDASKASSYAVSFVQIAKSLTDLEEEKYIPDRTKIYELKKQSRLIDENQDLNGEETDESNSYRLIVWHPALHRKYGEQLCLFLLSPDSYNYEYRFEVEKSLRTCGVIGFCIYEIYGNYDLLIRAWMTPEQNQYFMQMLEKETKQEISKKPTYVANDIYYLWSNAPDELTKEVLNSVDIERAINLQSAAGDSEYSADLLKKGIILKNILIRPTSKFSGIKFYMGINYSLSVAQPTVREELKAFLAETFSEKFIEMTIYSLSGAQDFWIKGIAVDSIYDIYDLAMKLVTEYRIYKMKTTTMIVATPRPFESDNINFARNAIPVEAVKLCKNFDLDNAAIDMLARNEKRLLEDKYEELEKYGLLTKNQDIFKTLFNAYAMKDEKKVKEQLYILTEFEGNLREFSLRIMQEEYGTDWIKTDLARLGEAVGLKILYVEKMSMSDWTSIMGKVDQEKVSAVKGKLKEDDWEKTMRSVATLRNMFAHGRYGNGDLIDRWGIIIDCYIKLWPIKAAFEEYLGVKVNPSPDSRPA